MKNAELLVPLLLEEYTKLVEERKSKTMYEFNIAELKRTGLMLRKAMVEYENSIKKNRWS